MKAGVADANGIFPENTINHQVQLQLAEWTMLRQHYAGKENGES